MRVPPVILVLPKISPALLEPRTAATTTGVDVELARSHVGSVWNDQIAEHVECRARVALAASGNAPLLDADSSLDSITKGTALHLVAAGGLGLTRLLDAGGLLARRGDGRRRKNWRHLGRSRRGHRGTFTAAIEESGNGVGLLLHR